MRSMRRLPSTQGESEPLGIEAFQAYDKMREALSGQFTGGASPGSAAMAYFDWAFHLASAPGKRMELAVKADRKWKRLSAWLWSSTFDPQTPPAIEPLPGDNRFSDEAWSKPPFSWMAQAFLLEQQWLHNVTHEVPGMTKHHEEVGSFAAKQMLDVFAPSSNPFTNPEVIARTWATGGMNFVKGFQNLMEDQARKMTDRPAVGTEAFLPGETVAVSPGNVVYRNHLIELIQYSPTTDKVHPEPVLVVPAWIMKYYILDLSPENSLIRWLVAQGHTVFAISWRNPDVSDRDLEMEDYLELGVMAALSKINTLVPKTKVHGVGYCLGGTLLSIAAAAMGGQADDRLSSVTLLAAQVDFTEPGELALFIDPSQLHFLDSMMWNRGYLSADQMSGAFQLLRSNDLVWSRMVREYMMGERTPMNDLMAWNADSTRMPYRMHSEYLRKLYLNNELSSGRFIADGQTVLLQNIQVPLFAVGTERDHVAPWKSVYKIHQFTDCEVTFTLTSGGHNAGIVSPPDHPRRHYRLGTHKHGIPLLSAEDWQAKHEQVKGSWWLVWQKWLAAHSSAMAAPPAMGTALAKAPGTYVFQK
ncbi:MAG: alpha/beta fold hydrolase [Sphingomonadales bacterium]|nr:MAG: alpha/beta fold hydrolase [Sphingomonadales bacterium]